MPVELGTMSGIQRLPCSGGFTFDFPCSDLSRTSARAAATGDVELDVKDVQ